MANSEYVRDYFSDHASDWLAAAYALEELPAKYPVGLSRVRLTLKIINEHLGRSKGHLLDLGCGGGELCIAAANFGFQVTGIDIAKGMIEKAQRSRRSLPEELQARIELLQGDVLATGLDSQAYEMVSSLGLIEYLPEDWQLFAEAFRLLKPGGVFVLSCRNRLFNSTSMNDYTQKEIERGSMSALVDESNRRTSEALPTDALQIFLAELKNAFPKLEKALELDLSGKQDPKPPKPKFTEERRQHTPDELWKSAQKAGFETPQFYGVHPHPFVPRLKFSAPRFFTQLARVYESFEAFPISLTWSSAFIASFRKSGTKA